MERFRAKVIPLREGRRQEKEARWEYTHAASIAQAHHYLMKRFPYPRYFVEGPMPDPEREPKDARCAKLLPFRETIRNELADEQKAADMYHDWSAKFTELNDSHKADVVRLIAGQEMLHWLVLDSIVQDITKECGK